MAKSYLQQIRLETLKPQDFVEQEEKDIKLKQCVIKNLSLGILEICMESKER